MDLPGANEARLAGIHLEGPYICSAKRGAQPLAPIRPPDIEELAHWIDISEGAIKLITIAPDAASDGGREFIEFAKSQGIVVSIGHTNATYDQANAAIGYGATHATHLFNAMPPLHHREPGTVGAVLASENVMVELIADGVHVHPAIAKIIVQAKGADKVILITDAISGAAMPDSTYKLGGQDVIVSNGTAKFHDGTLAGSVLTMNQAFDNIQHFANITAESAAKMSSLNAARQFGMDSWTGSIAPDKRADIAVLNTKTGNVVAAMRDGNWVYQA
jgi:N-acetylglucosamine-6-phosphate deacetylase